MLNKKVMSFLIKFTFLSNLLKFTVSLMLNYSSLKKRHKMVDCRLAPRFQ